MHELSVCTALLEQVERVARDQGMASVTAIVLKIGPLSGVEPELLRSAYPIASAGTVAEHAELVIESAIVKVRCIRCDAESVVAPNRLRCASCGDFRTRLLEGDELVLQRVELAGSGPAPDALAGAAPTATR